MLRHFCFTAAVLCHRYLSRRPGDEFVCGVAATKDQIAELMGTVCTLLTHIAYNSPDFKWCIALHAIDPLLLLLVRERVCKDSCFAASWAVQLLREECVCLFIRNDCRKFTGYFVGAQVCNTALRRNSAAQLGKCDGFRS